MFKAHWSLTTESCITGCASRGPRGQQYRLHSPASWPQDHVALVVHILLHGLQRGRSPGAVAARSPVACLNGPLALIEQDPGTAAIRVKRAHDQQHAAKGLLAARGKPRPRMSSTAPCTNAFIRAWLVKGAWGTKTRFFFLVCFEFKLTHHT